MIRKHLEQATRDAELIKKGKQPKQKDLVLSYEKNQSKNAKAKETGQKSDTQKQLEERRQSRLNERKGK